MTIAEMVGVGEGGGREQAVSEFLLYMPDV